MDKARRAYQRKDYHQVDILTTSALQLDPARQDVLALRDAAFKAMQKPTPDGKLALLTTVAAQPLPNEATSVAEPEKAKASEVVVVPNPGDAKLEAQEQSECI